MKTKRILATALTGVMLAMTLASCGSSTNSGFDTISEIAVISREDGSGTRSAFIELTGVQEEVDGNKTDNTVATAIIQNNTQAVMTGVAGDPTAIGYISLGSLNDTVTAMKIEGVAPSAETVKDGSYKISRPFNIATKDVLSESAQNFIDYILSAEGQSIVAKEGYVEVIDNAEAFAGAKGEGTVRVGGSSSVSPVMEKLAEEYEKVNPKVNIEVNTSDSSTGMSAASGGTVDIGMASRDLKDSEIKKGLTGTAIAKDGVVVIVNKENTITDLTLEQIRKIYTGKTTTWELG